jgi:hypothetical protein
MSSGQHVYLVRAFWDGQTRRLFNLVDTFDDAMTWAAQRARGRSRVEVHELVDGASVRRWDRDDQGDWTGPVNF